MSLFGMTIPLANVACSAGKTYVKNIGTRGAYIADTCARRAYTRSAYTGSTCAKGTYTRVAFDKVAYVGSVCTVEHSGIHSQFF